MKIEMKNDIMNALSVIASALEESENHPEKEFDVWELVENCFGEKDEETPWTVGDVMMILRFALEFAGKTEDRRADEVIIAEVAKIAYNYEPTTEPEEEKENEPMTTTYNITYNAQYDSHEVTFESKPATAVLDALKALKMRWNPKKACWYGFAKESEILSAILDNGEGETITGEKTEGATVYTDGYLGGGAVYGSKSNLHLYGTDLAKAIRADLKAAGIKGVTVASKHGSIRATITTNAADVVTEDEFIADYRVNDSFGWLEYFDENGRRTDYHIADYYNLPAEMREKIRLENARREYARDYANSASLNHYYIDKYTGFTDAGRAKIKAVIAIIAAYRYDESNGMVDYFNTNFYFDVYTKPATVKPTTPDDEPTKPAKEEPKEEPSAEETAHVQPAEQAQEVENAVESEEPATIYKIDDNGHDIIVKCVGDDCYTVEYCEDGKRLGEVEENCTAEYIDFRYGILVNPEQNTQNQPEPTPEAEPAETITESAGDAPAEASKTAEPMPEPVKPSPIREDLARRAHEMMSYTDYREGSATAEYNTLCDRAEALAEEQKRKVDPMYHDKIDALLASYVRRMADNINRRNEIGTRCPSVLVAGPANFPVKKKLKQNAASDRNMEEYNEIQGILNKIRSVGTGGISGDDPNAREKIEKKIESLEAFQNTMKAVNAYYRKHKTLDGCPDITPEQAHKIAADMERDWRSDPRPFEAYRLQNNNAEIHRLRERLAEMDAMSANSETGWTFDGGTVEICRENNRVRIFHDCKPDASTIAELKSHGFKWSPKSSAWQRQLTENAINAARRITK